MTSYAPFLFMAYLARRPNTYLIRLLLLPAVITATLSAAYGYAWTIPELNVYNWGQCESSYLWFESSRSNKRLIQGLFAGVAIAKAFEYAFTKEGMLKVGETRPGETKGKQAANGHAGELNQPGSHSWFHDAIELSHTMRGLEYKFGQGTHIPAETKPLERVPFLRATLLSFIKNYLVLDILEGCVKFFPGVGTPSGGSMFYPQLSPIPRYLTSTAIHMLTGSSLLAGFNMVYDLITLIVVGLGGSPRSWPPIMDHPWSSDSMHSFWSKGWHQLLRRTFVVLGGYPGKWIAGDIGMLLGTFIASGLYHESTMYAMGRGLDHTVTLFFAMQGPILIVERLWRKVTGRRVGGWIGRAWTYFIMFVAAQPMGGSFFCCIVLDSLDAVPIVNAWHERGLGGGMVIPPFISPFRFLVGLAVRYLNHSQ